MMLMMIVPGARARAKLGGCCVTTAGEILIALQLSTHAWYHATHSMELVLMSHATNHETALPTPACDKWLSPAAAREITKSRNFLKVFWRKLL